MTRIKRLIAALALTLAPALALAQGTQIYNYPAVTTPLNGSESTIVDQVIGGVHGTKNIPLNQILQGGSWVEVAKSASYTIAAADANANLLKLNGTAFNLTLNTGVIPAGKFACYVKNDTSGNTWTIVAGAGVTINGLPSTTVAFGDQGCFYSIDGSNFDWIGGSAAPSTTLPGTIEAVTCPGGQAVTAIGRASTCNSIGGSGTPGGSTNSIQKNGGSSTFAGSSASDDGTTFQESSEAFALNSSITPTALSGNVNDYNPSGLATAIQIRQDGGSADRTITGLTSTGAVNGRLVIITNIGATNNLILSNQDSGSAAANRFDFPANVTLPINASVALWYDTTSSRWRGLDRVLAATGVTAGSYTCGAFTVGTDGRLTAASTGACAFLGVAQTFTAQQTFGSTIGSTTTQSGTTYTLASTDCGTTVQFTAVVTVTIVNSLPVGCSIAMEAENATAVSVTLAAGSGATLHKPFSNGTNRAQYSTIGITIESNSGGSSAVAAMWGDGA